MKMVIVFRDDLNISPAKTAEWVARAVLSPWWSGWKSPADDPRNKDMKKVKEWTLDGPVMSLSIVKIGSEDELWALVERASSEGVQNFPVQDCNEESSTLMCAAFGPDDDELVDKITGGLKLL